MQPDLSKIISRLTTIQVHIQQMTGLLSRWNGQINLSEDVDVNGQSAFSAKKEWGCGITLHISVLEASYLFETLVHEMLHSLSVGLTRTAFWQFRGYEEGIVEKLTRSLGPQIAAAMSVAASFETRDSFDNYLVLLEQLRTLAAKSEPEFYLGLLSTPLEDRETTVVSWIMNADSEQPRARILAKIAPSLRGLRG